MRLFTISLATLMLFFMESFTSKQSLSVTSRAFASNGHIPARYSCHGQEVSPPLTISNIPSGAKSLAIIVHDPDAPRAGGFTHWVIWNVDVQENIPENFKPDNEGLNGEKKNGYKGMCPPSGTHHYHFMVYALDNVLHLRKDTDKDALEKAMQGHILASGDLIGLFNKDDK
jgi:Raf kinase inhibitor-like YbhB/YbcL family protein